MIPVDVQPSYALKSFVRFSCDEQLKYWKYNFEQINQSHIKSGLEKVNTDMAI